MRRCKRTEPSIKVGIVFWSGTGSGEDNAAFAERIGADFVAIDMIDAVRGALSDRPPVAFEKGKRIVRRIPTSSSLKSNTYR